MSNAARRQAQATFAGMIMAGLGLAGCDTARYTEAFEPGGDITHVVIRSDSGVVELSGSEPRETVRVERTIRAPEGALELSHHVELNPDGMGETLTLEARCAPIVPCAVDMRLELPEGVTVEVVLDHGEVWANDLEVLSVEVARGNLSADVTGSLTARVGSGHVLAALPAQASATIAVAQGDIDLLVPSGPWELNTEARSLSIDGGILPPEPAAGRLELIAPAGRVTVAAEPARG